MRALKIFIANLALFAFLIVGTPGVQAAEKETLSFVPAPGPSASAQENLITAITKVAEAALPAVVLIQVTEGREVSNPLLPYENNPFFQKFFGLPKKMPKKFKEEVMGLGSGMIISSDGLILSNNHVVGGATQIKVLLASGDEYPAKLVGTDPLTDLGVIKISAAEPLPYVTFVDSDDAMVGQWVVAIGQPRGLKQSVTQGIVSAKHRTGISNPSSYEDFLQTDVPINPGNSGGPLLTLTGHVIGVNSAIATESGGFEGIGFAIPSKMAVHVANSLIAYGKVVRGWLGVSVEEVTPAKADSLGLPTHEGALVQGVMKGGPADEAGIEKGDVILKYGGQKVSDATALRNMVAGTAPGKEEKVELWRDKKPAEKTLKIGNLDELAKKLAAIVKDRLGAEVGAVTAEEAQNYGMPSPEGVTIESVEPHGPLGKAGFEKGDLILAVNRQPVPGVDSFASIIENLPHGQKVNLLARDHRTGNTGFVQVEVN